MEELIEELTKVNPANLSEEGLKLFNKINEIIDEKEMIQEELNSVKEIYYTQKEIETDYIPKSKIREKIEECKKQFHFFNSDKRQTKNIAKTYEMIIDFLQDLLEENKKEILDFLGLKMKLKKD